MPVKISLSVAADIHILNMAIWRQKELIKANKRELARMQLQLAKLKAENNG